jgi:Ankyrin repeats (3 copies)
VYSIPIFSVLNSSIGGNSKLIQYPPTWSGWLKAFHVLVQHGASVHEMVQGRAVSAMNLIRRDLPEESLVEFFNILKDQYFLDFHSIDTHRWCALMSAIRSRCYATEAINFLLGIGIDFNRIYEDGSTALHWAAEMASHRDILKQVCAVAGLQNLNRQDKHGWTPLHYAVISAHLNREANRYEKLTYLLDIGADYGIKGRHNLLFCGNRKMMDEITPYQLAMALNIEVAETFSKEAARVIEQAEFNENDIFEDALECQTRNS